MRNFTLMILAAGFGKRMENLTNKIPKPLLKINNTTMLSNTINFFDSLGCNKIVINTHHLYENIKNYVNFQHFKKNINIIYEPDILDTGGGVKNAIRLFNNNNFLVTNSDIFWKKNNINDVKKFINQIDKIKFCCLLLSNIKDTYGINKQNGDFVFKNNYLERWDKNNPIIFYSGLQILNPIIFNDSNKIKFSMNEICDKLIKIQKLQGIIMKSNLFHIGDKTTYKKFNQNKILD